MRRFALAGVLAAAIGGNPVFTREPDWSVRAPLRADRTGTFRDPRLTESSGVAASRSRPGLLWTMNDSGNDPVLYATDTLGADLGAFTVTGAANRDWEATAAGRCGAAECLYVADTGDNHEARAQVVIYRVPEPSATPGARAATAPAESLAVRYPDAPHDVEAMYVDSAGDIHLVTKGRTDGVLHFRVRGTAWGSREPVTAEGLGSLPLDPGASLSDRITDAAISADGGRVVVRTYRRLHFFVPREDGRLEPLGAPAVACSVAGLEPQGEAVDWLDEAHLVLTSERFPGLSPGTIHVVECPLP